MCGNDFERQGRFLMRGLPSDNRQKRANLPCTWCVHGNNLFNVHRRLGCVHGERSE